MRIHQIKTGGTDCLSDTVDSAGFYIKYAGGVIRFQGSISMTNTDSEHDTLSPCINRNVQKKE